MMLWIKGEIACTVLIDNHSSYNSKTNYNWIDKGLIEVIESLHVGNNPTNSMSKFFQQFYLLCQSNWPPSKYRNRRAPMQWRVWLLAGFWSPQAFPARQSAGACYVCRGGVERSYHNAQMHICNTHGCAHKYAHTCLDIHKDPAPRLSYPTP